LRKRFSFKIEACALFAGVLSSGELATMCKVNSSLQIHCLSDSDGGSQSHWAPNTDVYTTDKGLVAKLELAGMRPDALELIIEGNRLIISGERSDSSRVPGIKYLVMEIRYGSFECVLDVPAGYDLAQARAVYQNGFLRVDVPLAVKPISKTYVPVSSHH
jgi:HSP20 family protein